MLNLLFGFRGYDTVRLWLIGASDSVAFYTMVGIIERSDMLRSNTIINNTHAPQGCRPALQYLSPNGDAMHRNYGLTRKHKRHGFAVIMRFALRAARYACEGGVYDGSGRNLWWDCGRCVHMGVLCRFFALIIGNFSLISSGFAS